MPKSTEKLIPNILPPKTGTLEDIDWMQILNSFEPSNLSEEVLLEFAGKYPDYTNVGVEERCYNIDNL